MDTSEIIGFYESELARYGPDDPRSLHWISNRTQRTRFEVLYEVGSWDGVSVSDVGSGLGDFVGFLLSRGLRVAPASECGTGTPPAAVGYIGYDVTPGMIEAARAKYLQGEFHLRDVLAEGFALATDYVVASGTFNVRTEGHDRFLRAIIAAMYTACRRAVAFNFLARPGGSFAAEDTGPSAAQSGIPVGEARIRAPRLPFTPPARRPLTPPPSPWDSHFYYEADPAAVEAYCRTLTPRVVRREGYLHGDCTIYMYR